MIEESEKERMLREKDALIARLKATTWNENVRFLAESKENLLQQYVNLTQYYGEQKHEIRRLKDEIRRLKDRSISDAKET